MPSHDLLPGDRSPAVQGIGVITNWGPPVQVMLVASKGTGLVIIDDTATEGTERPIWELVKVTKTALHLKCACGKPHCTRTESWKRVIKGHHPQSR